MIKAQLEAIRASALAQVAMADALLAALSTEASAATLTGIAGGALGVCRHPAEGRLDAARMGAPRAWVCGDCGFLGDGPDNERTEGE